MSLANFGFSPMTTNNFTGYSHVTAYSNLPAASAHTYEYWIVDTTTGVFLINQKKAGFYKSDGTNWNYIGTSVDMTSLSDGTNAITGSPVTLSGSGSTTVTTDTINNKIVISSTSSGGVWGSISGTLSNQADLNTALGNKVSTTTTVNGHALTADVTVSKADVGLGNVSDVRAGYPLLALLSNGNPADGSIYYIGNIPSGILTTAGTNRIYIPQGGTITSFYGNTKSTVLGSSEPSSIYIRINNTTDYLVSGNVLFTSSTGNYFSNTSLNIAVSAGDYFEVKLVCASWTTNPTSIIGSFLTHISL